MPMAGAAMGGDKVALAARSQWHEHEGSMAKALGNGGRTGTHPRGGSIMRRWARTGGWRSTAGERRGD
jgi:hypothetical protein